MNLGRPAAWRKRVSDLGARGAFTLIEIMVVVAIIGLIMAAGAPTLYKALNREGFRKTVGDIMDVLTTARERAILQGKQIEVQFNMKDRTCSVSGEARAGSGTFANTAKIDEGTIVEMLDVNLREYKDADSVRVRFFQNGTSDELTLVLRSEKSEYAKISLEITTGLASIDTDPSRWLRR